MKFLDNKSEFTREEKKSLWLLFFFLIISLPYLLSKDPVAEVVLSEDEYKIKMAEMTHSRLDDFYNSLPLKATAVSVFNSTKNDFIYNKNESEVMPLASIVKVMSAIIALENISRDEIIRIDREALKQVGDHGLLVDELWGRDDLVSFTLITSSNDAMRAIAMHVGAKSGKETEDEQVEYFVGLMNQKAKDLDLKSLKFFNDTGLDMGDKNGAYGNTKDVVMLFNYALEKYPEIFQDSGLTSKEFISISGKNHIAQNTNQNIPNIQNLFASKTGFTNIAGGNLVISSKTQNGDKIIISVLGSTFVERFSDVEKLSITTMTIINEFEI